MIASRRIRFSLLAQNGLFAALLVAAALLLAHLAQQHYRQWDLTQNGRNSLSAGSVQTLGLLKGPVTITAYATETDPTVGDLRVRIADFVAPFRRVKPDLVLAFVDPRAEPKRTEAANVRVNGEMVVAYEGREEHLTALDETSLTNLLSRLARNTERTVFFLDGHGERSPQGNADRDLGLFARRLGSKGFKVNLREPRRRARRPDERVDARRRRSEGRPAAGRSREAAHAYLDRGGNLLWLIDQEPLHGLQPIADFLGLQLTPGVVIDPSANEMKASATLAIAFAYGNHPATRGFVLNTAFPSARRIAVVDDPKPWRYTRLVEVAQRGWVETGPLDTEVGFDKNRDVKGPVTVAGALERDVDGKAQRVVIVGSGRFLANTDAGLLGNLDLGVNLVNWLSGDEHLITLEPRSRVDSSLELSRSWLLFLALGFLFALPGAFLFTGGMIWWRRRRA
jgi:ABC-type uncharacterized transport system involved in gliding motility auxiliary subunit